MGREPAGHLTRRVLRALKPSYAASRLVPNQDNGPRGARRPGRYIQVATAESSRGRPEALIAIAKGAVLNSRLVAFKAPRSLHALRKCRHVYDRRDYYGDSDIQISGSHCANSF